MQEYDLSHVNKQIQRDTADAEFARQKAKEQRDNADQKYRENNPDGARYHEQEADRFDRKGDELENEIDQLQSVKKRLELRLAELEDERARTDRTHADRLAQINKEIAEVRGSGMML